MQNKLNDFWISMICIFVYRHVIFYMNFVLTNLEDLTENASIVNLSFLCHDFQFL